MSTPAAPAPATATATPAAQTKTVKHRGLLNKQQLAEISHTGVIYGLINGDPTIFAQIQDTDVITPAFMVALGNDLATIGQYTGGSAQASVDTTLKTSAEETAKNVLLGKIHYIQSKAKIKYTGDNAGVLPEYGIGVRIEASRPALETAADGVLNKLKTDTLPKITAQHSADLQTALTNYRQSKVAQLGQEGDSTATRAELTTMVDSFALRRRQLQHAVDGEYPYTDPANAGIRRKFDLPKDHSLSL